MTVSRNPARVATLLLCASFSAVLQANDFPTLDRVMYVRDCMRENPGPQFEMISKCSCALDRMAEQVKYDEYVTLSTDANATSIGGERGSAMRDNEGVQKEAKRFRELQAKVKNSCFIGTGPK